MESLDFFDKNRDSSLIGFSTSSTGFSNNGLDITFFQNKNVIDEKISKQQNTVLALFELAKLEGDHDFAAITLLYYVFERTMPDGSHKIIADLILGGSIEPNYTDEQWKEKLIENWRNEVNGKPSPKNRYLQDLRDYLESLGYDLGD